MVELEASDQIFSTRLSGSYHNRDDAEGLYPGQDEIIF